MSNFAYDVENRLVSAAGARNASLVYDPAGRLFEISGGGVVTRFLYDGDALLGEYASSGALLRRYVHGPGVDEPLLWYEGSGLADRRGLLANHQGSIVGVTNAGGGVVFRNTYEEYGALGASNGGRFSYTGQIVIPELGLLHYKARAYNASLGRFLQTDPVGYDDDLNLYAYVGNDPLNRVDPLGLYECSGSKSDCGTIKGYVTTAQTALKGLDPKSDAAKKLGATLGYLGKPGEKNGVTITSTSLAKGTLASAGSGGQINVDIKQINAAGARADYGTANPGMSTGAIQQGIGAGALAHEARHELDFNRIGFPNSKAAEYRTELNAYRTQQGVGQGLNMSNGIYTPGATQGQMDSAVQQGAQRSTDAWCAAGGPC